MSNHDAVEAHYGGMLAEVQRPHLHHYVDGVCSDPRAPGGPCGEPQRYRPPTGRGFEFTDELIPRSLVAPIFRLAAGGYEGKPQQLLDSEDVMAWVLPLLD